LTLSHIYFKKIQFSRAFKYVFLLLKKYDNTILEVNIL